MLRKGCHLQIESGVMSKEQLKQASIHLTVWTMQNDGSAIQVKRSFQRHNGLRLWNEVQRRLSFSDARKAKEKQQ
jgi:hypothetical protein